MKTKNIFNLIFLFLILIAPAMAQPPFQENSLDALDDELEITYPKNEYYPFNESIKLHFHIFKSNASILNESEVDCNIHIYDKNNNHLLKTALTGDGVDQEVVLNNSFTDELGIIPYTVWCNSSFEEFGFISAYYIVTEDGNEKDNSASGLLAIIALIPLVFGLFMIIGAATLGKDHDVLRIVLFLMSPITIFVSFNFAMVGVVKYYGLFDLQDAIGSTTYWMSWWFFVLVAYFLIYGIWKWADTVAQKKNERMNY